MIPRVIADLPVSPTVMQLLAGKVDLVPWDSRDGKFDAIYTYGHPRVDGEMMDQLAGIRVISNFGVGVDHIDIAAATARGIPVGNTPGILDGATADLAFSLILAAGRRIIEGDAFAKSPAFTHYDPTYLIGREVHHATLGIFGMGRIGEQVAQRARGFDMNVLYHNRNRRPDVEARLNVKYVSKAELLASSDYVLVMLPLTAETRGMIGTTELRQMKPTAALINVARGAHVDTAALMQALQNRTIRMAALDVTDPEPLPRDHPLLMLDNVIITPHLGSATEETRLRMAQVSVENLLAGLAGKPLCHVVA